MGPNLRQIVLVPLPKNDFTTRCVWPSWLQLYHDTLSNVSLYRHDDYGLVYAVRSTWTGPSSFERSYRIVAYDWYSATTKFRLIQTRDHIDFKPAKTRSRPEIDQKWWSKVKRVHEQCEAPKPCKRPEFLHSQWIEQKMHLRPLSPEQIRDKISVRQYHHKTLENVFSITWSGIADAPTGFYNSKGEHVFSAYDLWNERSVDDATRTKQKQWFADLVFIGKCL